jgi:hypothetical protein
MNLIVDAHQTQEQKLLAITVMFDLWHLLHEQGKIAEVDADHFMENMGEQFGRNWQADTKAEVIRYLKKWARDREHGNDQRLDKRKANIKQLVAFMKMNGFNTGVTNELIDHLFTLRKDLSSTAK